jgi:hypothetical protein
MSRVTEGEIGEAVLAICANAATGECSIADLKDEIPNYLDLSADDRVQSTTRPNEEMWEQQVRNLISHRTTAGNIICDGYADYTGSAIRITDSGRRHVMRT